MASKYKDLIPNMAVFGAVGFAGFYFTGLSWPVGLAAGICSGLLLTLLKPSKKEDDSL